MPNTSSWKKIKLTTSISGFIVWVHWRTQRRDDGMHPERYTTIFATVTSLLNGKLFNLKRFVTKMHKKRLSTGLRPDPQRELTALPGPSSWQRMDKRVTREKGSSPTTNSWIRHFLNIKWHAGIHRSHNSCNWQTIIIFTDGRPNFIVCQTDSTSQSPRRKCCNRSFPVECHSHYLPVCFLPFAFRDNVAAYWSSD